MNFIYYFVLYFTFLFQVYLYFYIFLYYLYNLYNLIFYRKKNYISEVSNLEKKQMNLLFHISYFHLIYFHYIIQIIHQSFF